MNFLFAACLCVWSLCISNGQLPPKEKCYSANCDANDAWTMTVCCGAYSTCCRQANALQCPTSANGTNTCSSFGPLCRNDYDCALGTKCCPPTVNTTPYKCCWSVPPPTTTSVSSNATTSAALTETASSAATITTATESTSASPIVAGSTAAATTESGSTATVTTGTGSTTAATTGSAGTSTPSSG